MERILTLRKVFARTGAGADLVTKDHCRTRIEKEEK
jgi:hypothetical protein